MSGADSDSPADRAPDGRRSRFRPGVLLAALAVIVVLAALLTPELPVRSGDRSSYSADPAGARIAFELAGRMGWRASRRIAPMDTAAGGSRSVQVVYAPRAALGATEVHALLMNVRRGGGLVFAVDDAGEIADSLGLGLARRAQVLVPGGDSACPRPSSIASRAVFLLPTTVQPIVWRRPAPGPVVGLAVRRARPAGELALGVGFPLGNGRVAALTTSALLRNDIIRMCGLGADLAVARAFEYVAAPVFAGRRELVFDDYHHGYGTHPGSIQAITRYLGRTSSGRLLAQALAAGLLLVLARAPRPVVPRESARPARRSPLEHADALGRAYADVGATQTAVSLLLAGLRRRVGRLVAAPSGAGDLVFLDAVARRSPALAAPARVVQSGLARPGSARELVAVGDALREIERSLTSSLPSRS